MRIRLVMSSEVLLVGEAKIAGMAFEGVAGILLVTEVFRPLVVFFEGVPVDKGDVAKGTVVSFVFL